MNETNQDGVSLDDLANMLDDDQEQTEQVSETEELETVEQTDDQEPDAEEAEAAPEDPIYKVKVDGKELEVPLSELLNGYSRSQDYTRKTQEVAEMRRTVEQQAQLFQQQQAVMSANIEKVAEIKSIQDKLSQFEQVDWNTITDQDPVQAQKLLIARQNLERQLSVKAQEYQQSLSQSQQLMAQQRQQQLQEAAKELHRVLPEFNEQLAERIRTSTKAYGYTDQELANVTDPRLVKVLHDAMQWQQLQKQKPVAMKKVADAPKAIKPQSSAPKPRTQAALQRLKTHGRVDDLAAFL